ncbi:hypothetical protein GDO81_027532 [Engystomops pustulosus]|uniref:Alpha/beta hydrolase n=1 Tax=Engystomops pustulosus TaxID=76066 RepID=A0AAV6Z117_ENGPU|nr:hypothetical protein GDO81_027532 [Engystomops pustulosus]
MSRNPIACDKIPCAIQRRTEIARKPEKIAVRGPLVNVSHSLNTDIQMCFYLPCYPETAGQQLVMVHGCKSGTTDFHAGLAVM